MRKTLLAVLVLTALAGRAHALQTDKGFWTQEAPLPTARKQLATATVALDDQIYTIGGVTSQGQISRAVEVYNLQTGAWHTAAPLPLALWRASAAASGGKLYVFGGYRSTAGFPFNPTNRVFEYDPASDAWRDRAPLPSARGYAAAVALDGVIHLMGGAANIDLDAHLVYDPAQDAWSQAPALPTPRSGLTAQAIDGVIYVAGGYRLAGGVVSQNVLEAYDATTQTWKRLANLPDTRHGLGSAALDGKFYAFGGQSSNGTSLALVYDPEQNRWAQLAEMPTGLIMAGVAAGQGAIHVLGGGPTGLGLRDAVNLHQVFHPGGA